jgi:hypothetical protein
MLMVLFGKFRHQDFACKADTTQYNYTELAFTECGTR